MVLGLEFITTGYLWKQASFLLVTVCLNVFSVCVCIYFLVFFLVTLKSALLYVQMNCICRLLTGILQRAEGQTSMWRRWKCDANWWMCLNVYKLLVAVSEPAEIKPPHTLRCALPLVAANSSDWAELHLKTISYLKNSDLKEQLIY